MKAVSINCVLCVVLAFGLLTTGLHGAELSPELKKKADQALLGVDDAVLRLNSGICRITGRTVYPGSGRVVEDNILLIFDYGTNNYRFENGNHMRALLNPDFFYEVWHPGNPSQVSVKRSISSDYEVTYTDCRIVDIQNIFCFTPVGPHKPFDYQESDFHKTNRDIAKIGYEELNADIVKVVTASPFADDTQIITEYYINTHNGYTPTHISLNHENFTHYTHDISWEYINSTWVPTTYSFKSLIGKSFSVDWKIEWEKVNEKIDPKLFDINEMLSDQKDGAVLLTTELGPNPVILGKVEQGESFKNQQPQPDKSLWFRIVLLSFGIIFIVVGLLRRFTLANRSE